MQQESCVSELEAMKVTLSMQVNQGKDHSTRIHDLEQLCMELKVSCGDLSTLYKQGHIHSDFESPSSELQVLKRTLDQIVSDGKSQSAKQGELERANHVLRDDLIRGLEEAYRELKQGQNRLESLLDSEHKFWKEQSDSESKSRACELEKLSLELSRKHSEALKLCNRSHHRCTQLEESVRRLGTADERQKGALPSGTSFQEEFESLLAPERKAWQELVGCEAAARVDAVHELRESFNAFITEVLSHASSDCRTQMSEMNCQPAAAQAANGQHHSSRAGSRHQRGSQRKS